MKPANVIKFRSQPEFQWNFGMGADSSKERFLALSEVSKTLSNHHTLSELLFDVRDCLHRMFGPDAGVLLHDRALNLPLRKKVSAAGVLQQIDCPVEASISGWVWRNQEAVILNDTHREIRFPEAMKVLFTNGLKSYCCIPLTAQRSKLGVLILWSRKRNAYLKMDPDFTKELAGQIAVALNQALRLQKAKTLSTTLEKRIQELEKANSQLRSYISRDKKLQKALNESEKRYHTIVDMKTDLICRYLPDTTLTFVNDAYCRYFGKTVNELIGTSFLQLLPEPDRKQALNHVQSLCTNPRLVQYEHQVVGANGDLRWQEWSDCAILDDEKNILELQAIGRDITERKLANDRQQKKFTEVIEIREKYEYLTRREREVMTMVVSGLMNKQVAAEIGVTEKTVKTHRHVVMEKMRARSLADLVRMAVKLSEFDLHKSSSPQ